MPLDVPTVIILITLFIIFMIFLVFDLFGRNEKYGYLAYPIALIPVNFYWGMGGDSLFTYVILFLLWIATILRDTIGVYRKKEKEINEILLYLALSVLIQLIISAIIPVNNPALQYPYTEPFWFFWLPNVHSAIFDPAIASTFRIVATILIFLIIVPLILDIKDTLITYFEKERIYEVIVNLLSNAIKYTPPNGKIIVRSEKRKGNYIISVQDTGIGLTDEEKEKIFKKFGKVERYGQGLDVDSEGSGLGLYISKKIIELHGGNIWVKSKGRKKGSTFYFSLPVITSKK